MTPDQRAILDCARSDTRAALENVLEAQRLGPPRAAERLRCAQHQIDRATEKIDRVLSESSQE